MVTAFIHGQMVKDTKELGKTDNITVKASLPTQKVLQESVFGTMVRDYSG